MHISLPSILTFQYPDFAVAFAAGHDIADYPTAEDRADAEAGIVAAVNAAFQSEEALKQGPQARAYAAFYAMLGVKPKNASTPAKQALRVLRNQRYRSIHRAIDLCMEIEYTSLVSFQIYDLDKIQGDLAYGFADGTERLIDFHGVPRSPEVGELILRDSDELLHAVTLGNNARKSIDEATRRFLVRIMAVPGVPRENFEWAIKQTEKTMPVAHLVRLSAQIPMGELKA